MLNASEANKLAQAAMIYLQDNSCSPGSSYWYKKPSEASKHFPKERGLHLVCVAVLRYLNLLTLYLLSAEKHKPFCDIFLIFEHLSAFSSIHILQMEKKDKIISVFNKLVKVTRCPDWSEPLALISWFLESVTRSHDKAPANLHPCQTLAGWMPASIPLGIWCWITQQPRASTTFSFTAFRSLLLGFQSAEKKMVRIASGITGRISEKLGKSLREVLSGDFSAAGTEMEPGQKMNLCLAMQTRAISPPWGHLLHTPGLFFSPFFFLFYFKGDESTSSCPKATKTFFTQ